MNKESESKTIMENFRSYWGGRETFECFFGISVLLHDEDCVGDKELIFDQKVPDQIPNIMLDGQCWQVISLRMNGKDKLELNLANNDTTKKVSVSDNDIEKFEAYKLLCAVFDNTEHEKDEGEDYEDVEEFYGWELS